MVQRFFTGLMGALLLLLHGAAFAAFAASSTKTTPASVAKRDAFATALRDTRIGSDPAQAYFLVRLLKDSNAPADDVEALRRELLHNYVEQLGGVAAPAPAVAPKPGVWAAVRSVWPGAASAQHDTVADAIARGRTRSDLPHAALTAAWETAFDKNTEIRWPPAGGPQPYFLMNDRNLQPAAPGLWVSEAANGQVQFKAALRVVNKAALPLPLWRPDLVLGGEPVTGRGGLTLACDWDGVRLPPGRAALDEVDLLPPGGESRALVCTSPAVGAYWKAQLPALVGKAQTPGQRPLLVSHAFDTRQRLPYLEVALADLSRDHAEWVERMRLSQREVGRQWRAAAQPLAPPVVQRWGVSPNVGWAAAGQKLQWFLGATLLALALFGVGRKALGWGWPPAVVGLGTLLVGAGLFALGLSRMGSGGTGDDLTFYMAIALWSVVVGPMALAVVALHALHKQLDAEDLTWLQTVVLGWRRALDFGSDTSRAEFWGFFAHCVWLWALARVCLVPLDLWVGAVLLIPFAALLVRRLRSLTNKQRTEMVITAVCVVLIVLSRAF